MDCQQIGAGFAMVCSGLSHFHSIDPPCLGLVLYVHYDKSMRYVAAILTLGPVLLAGDRFKRRPGRDNGCLGVDPIFTHFAICLGVEVPDTQQPLLKRSKEFQ